MNVSSHSVISETPWNQGHSYSVGEGSIEAQVIVPFPSPTVFLMLGWSLSYPSSECCVSKFPKEVTLDALAGHWLAALYSLV